MDNNERIKELRARVGASVRGDDGVDQRHSRRRGAWPIAGARVRVWTNLESEVCTHAPPCTVHDATTTSAVAKLASARRVRGRERRGRLRFRHGWGYAARRRVRQRYVPPVRNAKHVRGGEHERLLHRPSASRTIHRRQGCFESRVHESWKRPRVAANRGLGPRV